MGLVLDDALVGDHLPAGVELVSGWPPVHARPIVVVLIIRWHALRRSKLALVLPRRRGESLHREVTVPGQSV